MARFRDLPSSKWRRVGGVTYIHTKQQLYSTWDSFTAQELADRVNDCGFNDDAILELEADDGEYYDSSPRAILFLVGWRQASPKELEEALAELDKVEQSRKQWEENLLEQAKKLRPELFK